MALGGLCDLLFGVNAESRSLEDIAEPLTAADAADGSETDADGRSNQAARQRTPTTARPGRASAPGAATADGRSPAHATAGCGNRTAPDPPRTRFPLRIAGDGSFVASRRGRSRGHSRRAGDSPCPGPRGARHHQAAANWQCWCIRAPGDPRRSQLRSVSRSPATRSRPGGAARTPLGKTLTSTRGVRTMSSSSALLHRLASDNVSRVGRP